MSSSKVASEESTSCFVAMALVGVFAIGAAVLLWQVSTVLAVLASLLLWPSIGWVVAVTATRLRFGRTVSLRGTFGLLAGTILKTAYLLCLTGLAVLLSASAVAFTFAVIFGIVGTKSVEHVPWLVPLAASAIVLLCMAFTVRNLLWPLVREFWGVDTGECDWLTARNQFLFDSNRVRHREHFPNRVSAADQTP